MHIKIVVLTLLHSIVLSIKFSVSFINSLTLLINNNISFCSCLLLQTRFEALAYMVFNNNIL